MNIKTMRVYITENCNANCKNCFNAGTRTNAEITPDVFGQLCVYLKEHGIKNLKIMGGEPTIHKNFAEISSTAQNHFEKIYVFTNGTGEELQKMHPREGDGITYNFNFINHILLDNFLLDQPGYRQLEVQVNGKTDEIPLLEKIVNLAAWNKLKFAVSLTLDCVSNIFVERRGVIPKLVYLQEGMKKNGIKYSYDHKIPFCFLYKSGLKIDKRKVCLCAVQTAGLIDAHLDLRFCNQYSDKLISLIQGGRFIPWQIVENHIFRVYYINQVKALQKICLECVFYGVHCNGGCWIAKETISRDDVLEYSDFPIITHQEKYKEYGV